MWSSQTDRQIVFGLCRGKYVKTLPVPVYNPYGLISQGEPPIPTSGEYTRFNKTIPLIDTTSWKNIL